MSEQKHRIIAVDPGSLKIGITILDVVGTKITISALHQVAVDTLSKDHGSRYWSILDALEKHCTKKLIKRSYIWFCMEDVVLFNGFRRKGKKGGGPSSIGRNKVTLFESRTPIIMYSYKHLGVDPVQIAPTQWRKVLGLKRGATKQQAARAVQKHFPDFKWSRYNTDLSKYEDMFDSLCIGYCHATEVIKWMSNPKLMKAS